MAKMALSHYGDIAHSQLQRPATLLLNDKSCNRPVNLISQKSL